MFTGVQKTVSHYRIHADLLILKPSCYIFHWESLIGQLVGLNRKWKNVKSNTHYSQKQQAGDFTSFGILLTVLKPLREQRSNCWLYGDETISQWRTYHCKGILCHECGCICPFCKYCSLINFEPSINTSVNLGGRRLNERLLYHAKDIQKPPWSAQQTMHIGRRNQSYW